MEAQNLKEIQEKFPERIAHIEVASAKILRETATEKATGEKVEKVFVAGLAHPFDEQSRNGVIYRSDSMREKAHTMIGNPFLLNHNYEELPRGTVVEFYPGEKGNMFKAEIDPSEVEMIEKIEKGYLKHVSIGCMISNPEYVEEADVVVVDVDEYLELSAVGVPGFRSTDMATVMENFKMKKSKEDKKPEVVEDSDKPEDEEDEMSTLKNKVEELETFKADAENRIGSLEAQVATLTEEQDSEDDEDDKDDDKEESIKGAVVVTEDAPEGDKPEETPAEGEVEAEEEPQETTEDESDDEAVEEEEGEPAEDPKEETPEEETPKEDEAPAEGDADKGAEQSVDPAKAYEETIKSDDSKPKSISGESKDSATLDLRDVSLSKKGY